MQLYRSQCSPRSGSPRDTITNPTSACIQSASKSSKSSIARPQIPATKIKHTHSHTSLPNRSVFAWSLGRPGPHARTKTSSITADTKHPGRNGRCFGATIGTLLPVCIYLICWRRSLSRKGQARFHLYVPNLENG